MAFGPNKVNEKRIKTINDQVNNCENLIDKKINESLNASYIQVHLPTNLLDETIKIIKKKYIEAGWNTVKFDIGSSWSDSWCRLVLSTQ